MESTEYTFDELLCQSLLMFRQSRFYDNCQESEVEAYRMLEEAKLAINVTQDRVNMAKWGCAFECLVQKYYINGDTDRILENADVTLINFWKKIEISNVEIFPACLWLGYYFLLRFRNGKSGYQVRSKRMVSDILSFFIDFFHKLKSGKIPAGILSAFSVDVWGEIVYWAESVHNSRLCEKQSATLLHQLYNLGRTDLPINKPERDSLFQQMLEFCCF